MLELTPDKRMASEEEEPIGEVAENAGGAGGSKRDSGASNPTQAVKRPRYNDKSFGDLTINDIEGIVREVNMLKRQCVAKEEELTTLREIRTEKVALAKQLKALEVKAAASEKETEKCRTAMKEHEDDVALQANRLVKALKHTLSSQMVYTSSFKEQLQGNGRDIVAFAANVSPEVAKVLSVEAGSKNRISDSFFGEQITKTSNNFKLVMVRMMSVKYFKTTCELRVDATYTFEGAKKSAKHKKKAPRSKAKGAADADAEAGEEATAEEDDEDEEQEGAADEDVADKAVPAVHGGGENAD